MSLLTVLHSYTAVSNNFVYRILWCRWCTWGLWRSWKRDGSLLSTGVVWQSVGPCPSWQCWRPRVSLFLGRIGSLLFERGELSPPTSSYCTQQYSTIQCTAVVPRSTDTVHYCSVCLYITSPNCEEEQLSTFGGCAYIDIRLVSK
jgi:hypothetical protein